MPNKQGRKWIRDDKRLAIYLRDQFACQWCRRGIESGITLTLDHYFTRDRGGSNRPDNLITACHDCNSRRRNRKAHDWAKCVDALYAHPFRLTMRLVGNRLATPINREAAKAMIAGRGLTAAIAARNNTP